jgi:hypothetical protein
LDRKWTNIIIWPRDRASISVQQLRINKYNPNKKTFNDTHVNPFIYTHNLRLTFLSSICCIKNIMHCCIKNTLHCCIKNKLHCCIKNTLYFFEIKHICLCSSQFLSVPINSGFLHNISVLTFEIILDCPYESMQVTSQLGRNHRIPSCTLS